MAGIREKTCGTYEILLYIGSVEGYKGRPFSREELVNEIGMFQDMYPNSMPVRISPCSYIAGSKYNEDGHEISAIMYPNQYRNPKEMEDFMRALGLHLLAKFKQNRITMRKVVGEAWRSDVQPSNTVMFESEEAQISKSIQDFNATH